MKRVHYLTHKLGEGIICLRVGSRTTTSCSRHYCTLYVYQYFSLRINRKLFCTHLLWCMPACNTTKLAHNFWLGSVVGTDRARGGQLSESVTIGSLYHLKFVRRSQLAHSSRVHSTLLQLRSTALYWAVLALPRNSCIQRSHRWPEPGALCTANQVIRRTPLVECVFNNTLGYLSLSHRILLT